jgi:integrase
MGTIYKRKFKRKDGSEYEGKTWWIKYHRNGRAYFESTGSPKRTVARELLNKREGEIADGKAPGIHYDRVTFNELAEDLIMDYKVNRRKSLWRVEISRDHLAAFFGQLRAPEVTTARVKQYIDKRREAGAENATINRELAALKRMFSLAAQCTPPKVAQVPFIPMLKEDNIREGFFEDEEYRAVRGNLADYLKPVIDFGYVTGWRKSEILGLTWNRVNLREGTVRLEGRETKNKAARDIYLGAQLEGLLKGQMGKRRLGCPYVFHNEGRKIRGFSKAWATACRRAGVPGRLFHDLRRTAVRNMVRAGIPERVAMMISGHKTRSVFDRYNIVSPNDLKQAAARIDAYLEDRESTGIVTQIVTQRVSIDQRRAKGRNERTA